MKPISIFRFRSPILLVIALIAAHASASAQASVRVIDRPATVLAGNSVKGEGGAFVPTELRAIEIVSIKVEGRPVILGSPFSASNDWLKSLTVTVRNISDRPISSIRIHFGLPQAKYKEGIIGFSLEYGKELSTGIDYGDQKLILPGEEVDMVRSERHYERDRTGIEGRSGIKNFERVRLGITTLVFEDGTVWSSPKLPIQTDDIQ